MRVHLVAASAVAAATLVFACKKGAHIDRSSPEKTLSSFFGALKGGHIPDDLERLVTNPSEITTWRLRCKSRGCSGGSYTIVEHGETTDYEATLIVDYQVMGRDRAVVMRGQRSPIKLIREADGWRITQFGHETRHTTPAAPAPDAGAAADGGEARDGGAADGGAARGAP